MNSTRAELIGETAITLLAERGMRGLTHRAVDEAAGLPSGSTSNHARTRALLLKLTLTRLSELEEQHFRAAGTGAWPPGETELSGFAQRAAASIARLLYEQIYADRRRTLARYELALEATRRPELRAIYDKAGQPFRRPATMFMEALGSADPERHGRQLVAFAEGLIFDAIAGAGAEPSLADLQNAAEDFLRGIMRS
jgi:DNA-binding transcriptional regulator YbjK